MRKRKNVPVRDLVRKANDYFASEGGTREGRRMLQSFVESVLHETGNYHGFGYLNSNQVPEGQLPGIVYSTDGNKFPDDSRVVMYVRSNTV